MKKKTLVIVGIILIAVITVIIFKTFTKRTNDITFITAQVTKGNIANTVTATGEIQPVIKVEVGTQVSGIIDKLYVDFNDRVKKGQIIAELDKTALIQTLEQGKANVDQAEANLTFQEATYKRTKVLYEKNLISELDYDEALYNYESAKAALASSRSTYEKNRVNLGYATIYSPIDGVVLNRAVEEGQTVAAAMSTPELYTIANDLKQMEVKTSVDEADIGKVKEGQRVEFTVDAYTDIIFEGRVSEVRLEPTTTNNVVTYTVVLSAPNPDEKLMPGMTASATIYVEEKADALILTGKALRFTPDQIYMKKIMKKKLKNMPDSLKPKGVLPGVGQGAAMASQTGRSENRIDRFSGSIPQGTPTVMGSDRSRSDWKTKIVYIKDAKDGIRPIPVRTGIENGTDVEILQGLNEGDEVVISMNSSDEVVTTRQQNPRLPRGPFGF
jgi:HlyD family secretion protein